MGFMLQRRDNAGKSSDVGGGHAPLHRSFQVGEMTAHLARDARSFAGEFDHKCFVPLIVLQRRHKKAGSAEGSAPPQVTPSKTRVWLLIVLIPAVTLSGPLWLALTGTALSAPLLIVTSLISCVFAIAVFVFSWRYWNR